MNDRGHEKILQVNNCTLSKIWTDIGQKRVVSSIAKSILSSTLCDPVITNVIKIFDSECWQMCRQHQSCSQNTSVTDIIDISWAEVIEKMVQIAPLFIKFMMTVLNAENKVPSKAECLMGSLCSVLLFCR